MNLTVVAIGISGGVEHDEAAGLARLCCKATSMMQEPGVRLMNPGMITNEQVSKANRQADQHLTRYSVGHSTMGGAYVELEP